MQFFFKHTRPTEYGHVLLTACGSGRHGGSSPDRRLGDGSTTCRIGKSVVACVYDECSWGYRGSLVEYLNARKEEIWESM